MKILHLSTFDKEGGAARAANRLHHGLIDRGVDSLMAVKKKVADGQRVLLCGSEGKLGKAFSMLRPYVDDVPLKFFSAKKNSPWSIAWLPNRLGQLVNNTSQDLVHLHWTCNGFLSLHNLNQIDTKVICTLHDSWAFTGGCHIIGDCAAFREKCGHCPQLGSRSDHDLSRLGWHRKQRLYDNQKVVFVAPSSWMAEQARSSSLLENARIEIIPNGLDTHVFRPVDKHVARKMLRLPLDKKIILFGAMSSTTDPNKGFDKLEKVLSILKQSSLRDEVELAVFGAEEPVNKPDMGFRTNYLGRFHDDIALASVYSAADVISVPSIQESFGQVASEAMSCGTPVVAFRTSGLLDIVQHNITGYLARPYDELDFSKGLELLLSDPSLLKQMSIAARNRVQKHFDISLVSSQYLKLYENVLHG